jgi:DNA-binding transcriptional LysR family regulator
MDFSQLTTFLEVAKLGSFSRAGEKVFRSQSAVSAQIRQLEQEYGDRLLDRSGKDVTLTPAGRVLLAYAERLLQLRDESKLAVSDHGGAPRGKLVIGANEATCLYVLPDVFAKYCSVYPEVRLSIYRNFSYKIVEKLENGTIDVGIVTLPVKSPKLKTTSIFRDQLMWMVNPQNPLAKHEVVSVAKNRLHAPPYGQVAPALRTHAADPHGTAERGHDQELRHRRTWCFPGQRQFRSRSDARRTRQADSAERPGTVARTGTGLPPRPYPDPGGAHVHHDRAPVGRHLTIAQP